VDFLFPLVGADASAVVGNASDPVCTAPASLLRLWVAALVGNISTGYVTVSHVSTVAATPSDLASINATLPGFTGPMGGGYSGPPVVSGATAVRVNAAVNDPIEGVCLPQPSQVNVSAYFGGGAVPLTFVTVTIVVTDPAAWATNATGAAYPNASSTAAANYVSALVSSGLESGQSATPLLQLLVSVWQDATDVPTSVSLAAAAAVAPGSVVPGAAISSLLLANGTVVTAAASATPTPTSSVTPTPSRSVSSTPTPSGTVSTSATPTPTSSPTPTPTPSSSPSSSPLPNFSGTPNSGAVSGFRTGVNVMLEYRSLLYFGVSSPTFADKVTPTGYVVAWDGRTWSTIPCGTGLGVGSVVYAMTIYNDTLVIGGYFHLLGDGVTVANRVVSYNGSAWSTLGIGPSNGIGAGAFAGTVFGLAVYKNILYATGSFTTLGDGRTSAKNAAMFDGTAWSALGNGTSNGLGNFPKALQVYRGLLFFGGEFTTLGSGASAKYIATWNGTAWAPVMSGITNGVSFHVNAFSLYNGSLVVGGNFAAAGLLTARRVVMWNGTSWSALRNGTSDGLNSGSVRALTEYRNAVWTGGDFQYLGDGSTQAWRLAFWDSRNWMIPRAAGASRNGVGGTVNTMVVFQNVLYIAGSFTFFGDNVPCSNILLFNGSTLLPFATSPPPVASGLYDPVYSATIYNNQVVMGGTFRTPMDGSTVLNRIGMRNGTAWVPFDDGFERKVFALTTFKSLLYAAGEFTAFGNGTAVNYVAAWDGAVWRTLRSGSSNGVDDIVQSLCVMGTKLFVGGAFTLLGNGATSAKGIAAWDGAVWSVLGSGANNGVGGVVNAMAVMGTTLFVGGTFTLLGNGATSAKNIAAWNGAAWTVLGSGANNGVGGSVLTMAVYAGKLYVGGQFTTLGDGVTQTKFIAAWSGSAWSVPFGVSTFAYAMVATGTRLVVGGAFADLGDGVTSVNCILSFNGTAVSRLPSGNAIGVDDSVRALAYNNATGILWLGGDFAALGDGTQAGHVASVKMT
jgi:hypothetical protein